MPASLQRNTPTLAMVLVAISLASTTAHAQASSDQAAPPKADDQRYLISYVCGDNRIDGTASLPSDGHPYNLGVSFVSDQSGSPLSQVQVRLRRHGRVLVEFNATGPRCLFSVPAASYLIEATYQGETKSATVETGALNTQLRW
jgi:hypothetical protein